MRVDTKTGERTKGAATVVQVTHRDSCSANRVDPDPICSTSFGDNCTGPPALPCSRDALIGNGAAAPKSCLSPLVFQQLRVDKQPVSPFLAEGHRNKIGAN